MRRVLSKHNYKKHHAKQAGRQAQISKEQAEAAGVGTSSRHHPPSRHPSPPPSPRLCHSSLGPDFCQYVYLPVCPSIIFLLSIAVTNYRTPLLLYLPCNVGGRPAGILAQRHQWRKITGQMKRRSTSLNVSISNSLIPTPKSIIVGHLYQFLFFALWEKRDQVLFLVYF